LLYRSIEKRPAEAARRRAIGPADHFSGSLTSTPSVTRFWSVEEWSDVQIGGNGHFTEHYRLLIRTEEGYPAMARAVLTRSRPARAVVLPLDCPRMCRILVHSESLLCARPDDRRGQLASRVARIRAAAPTRLIAPMQPHEASLRIGLHPPGQRTRRIREGIATPHSVRENDRHAVTSRE
jgi:hypothetical protein